MNKFRISTCIVVCAIVLMPCAIFAGNELNVPIDKENVVEYVYATTTSTTLSINNGKNAKAKVSITGVPGKTTKLSATMYLQKYSNKSWKTVQKWSESSTLNSLMISRHRDVTKGKYRVHAVFKAYRNSNVEEIIKNSNTMIAK